MPRDWAGYVICDLDGCLSDDRWRRTLLPKTKPTDSAAYDKYHEQCDKDAMVESVYNDLMYDLLDESGEQRSLLLIVTGRPATPEIQAKTMAWLDKHVLAAHAPGFEALKYILLMRPVDSVLPAPTVKMHSVNDYFASVHADRIAGWTRVVSAYDDREDILAAYPIPLHCHRLRVLPSVEIDEPDHWETAAILRSMADTFEERNARYKDNYLRVAPVIKALWPDGVPPALVVEDRWHLFELLVVKLTRFAISGLTHDDSIHDAAVYAAMIESDLTRQH